jgi:hypothetical protein
MAFLDTPINAADLPVGQSGNFEPLPAGDYQVAIESAEIKDTNDRTGQYIKLKMKVNGPTHSGRVVFSNLNIRNKSPKAEEIGRQQLGDIMRAIGLATLTDTDQLIGAPLTVKLSVKPADGQYEAGNEVKAYKAGNGSAAPAPSFPAPSSAVSQPASASAPPWAKK